MMYLITKKSLRGVFNEVSFIHSFIHSFQCMPQCNPPLLLLDYFEMSILAGKKILSGAAEEG